MQIVSPWFSTVEQAPVFRGAERPVSLAPSDTFAPSDTPAILAPSSAAEAAPQHTSVGVRVAAGLLLTAAALGLAGCGAPTSQPPASSVSTQLTYTWMSTRDEVELGKQVSAQLEKQVPLWHDAAQQARVDRIGARLADDSSRKDLGYTFKLLDTDSVNAMAAPGGTIYLTRGLLQSFPDDGQLTFVMGHELGHVEARHSVKALGRRAAMDWALRAVLGNKGETTQTVARIAEGLLSNQFSQAEETEADEIGQQHLLRLDVNPWVAASAMQRLQAVTRNGRSNAVDRVFSDHPPTADRIDALEKGAVAAGFPSRPVPFPGE